MRTKELSAKGLADLTKDTKEYIEINLASHFKLDWDKLNSNDQVYISKLNRTVKEWVDAQNKKKRQGGKWSCKTTTRWHNWNEYELVVGLKFLPTPCKEWDALVKKVEKFTGKILETKDISAAYVFGKRNNYDVESIKFLAYQPKACKDFLSILKKGTNDKVLMENYHYLDDDNRYNRGGEDMESEWSGEEYYGKIIKITTPTGKVKKEIHICIY